MKRIKQKCLSLLLAVVLVITGVVPLTALAASGNDRKGYTSEDPAKPADAEKLETPDEEGRPSEEQDPGEDERPGEDEDPNEDEEPDEDEEPEKTLQELRDDLLAILGGSEETAAIREKIDRMIALEDPQGTLRTYLEGMIRLKQIEYEMERLQSNLSQLEASDPVIGEIAQATAELEAEEPEPDPVLMRIGLELSAPAARLMEDAGFDGTGDLADMALRALDRLDGTADSSDVAAILLLGELRDSGLLTDVGLVTVEDSVRQHFRGIMNRHPAISAQLLQQLVSASEDLARRANNAQAMSPQRIVAAGDTIGFTLPVFTYNGAIMLSVKDAAAFLGGTVVEMDRNDAVIIQAPDIVLEMVKGSSDAYLNDKLQKMEAAVLSFDGECYLPLNMAVRCLGLQCMDIDGYQLLYRP